MLIEIENPLEPLSKEAIQNAESALGVKFPNEYVQFLLKYNGGRPEPAGFDIEWRTNQPIGEDWRTSMLSWFLSIYDGDETNLLEYNKISFSGRIPKETIAIADDCGGNLILLGVSGEYKDKIFFWVKDDEVEEGGVPGFENVGFLANSFDEFLNEKLR